jgi:uncharacterized surface protein with fasciclin (FAS1) repeats
MRSLNRRHILVAATATIPLLAGVRAARAQSRNVIDTLAADGRFNRFLELVGRGGATDQFRGAGPMTVFAPTDAAFNQANFSRIQDLLTEGSSGNITQTSPDPIRLRSVIGYHVIPGFALTSDLLVGDQQIKTVAGGVLRIANQGGRMTVSNPAPEQQPGVFGAGGLNVMPPAVQDGPDIIATNGVIHPINELLFP